MYIHNTNIHTNINTYIFSVSQQHKGLEHVIVEVSKSHTIRHTAGRTSLDDERHTT